MPFDRKEILQGVELLEGLERQKKGAESRQMAPAPCFHWGPPPTTWRDHFVGGGKSSLSRSFCLNRVGFPPGKVRRKSRKRRCKGAKKGRSACSCRRVRRRENKDVAWKRYEGENWACLT